MVEALSLTLEALGTFNEICCEQPKPIQLPVFDLDEPRPASRASRPSQWLAEGRTLASRASSRASFTPRRTRRSTVGPIGAPFDFKKVEPPRERGFRPLTLSIHIAGNELPTLPEFDEAICDGDAGLTFPKPALTKARSETMLSRPSTAFSIPRKPVPSRAGSMDASRCSMDSHYTLNEPSRPSQSLHRRPSIAASQSTQDFLDALDARLPQSPPLLRSKSGPEPVYTLYRRASEQSLRLRTHLEERSQIERRFLDCDTILEDKENDGERSPVFTRPNRAATLGTSIPQHKLTQPKSTEWFRDHLSPLPLPPQPSRSAPPAPITLPSHSQPSFPPASPTSQSTRSRISQWLRSSPLASPTKTNDASPAAPFYSLRPSSIHKRTSISSSSIYSSSTAAETTTWTTPRDSPHRKGSSLSSCLTSVQPTEMGTVGAPGLQEKLRDITMEVRDVGVGVAF